MGGFREDSKFGVSFGAFALAIDQMHYLVDSIPGGHPKPPSCGHLKTTHL
jgi:hypothetical protein